MYFKLVVLQIIDKNLIVEHAELPGQVMTSALAVIAGSLISRVYKLILVNFNYHVNPL
jgi:hypothetical protein